MSLPKRVVEDPVIMERVARIREIREAQSKLEQEKIEIMVRLYNFISTSRLAELLDCSPQTIRNIYEREEMKRRRNQRS